MLKRYHEESEMSKVRMKVLLIIKFHNGSKLFHLFFLILKFGFSFSTSVIQMVILQKWITVSLLVTPVQLLINATI